MTTTDVYTPTEIPLTAVESVTLKTPADSAEAAGGCCGGGCCG